MIEYPKLKSVKPIDDYKLILEFGENEKRLYNFTPNLSHAYYKELTNKSLFKKVSVNNGEIEWSTGQDFCPHTLYEESVPYEI